MAAVHKHSFVRRFIGVQDDTITQPFIICGAPEQAVGFRGGSIKQTWRYGGRSVRGRVVI